MKWYYIVSIVVLVIVFLLLLDGWVGFDNLVFTRKVCRFDDGCVPGIIAMHEPPCCSEVGLFRGFNFSNTLSDAINLCCFPLDCSQSKNNPELCTCIYAVMCYDEPMNLSEFILTEAII